MKALITINVIVPVSDEEEAYGVALRAEKDMRINTMAALERLEGFVESGITWEQLQEYCRVLGVQVSILPELRDISEIEA